MNKIVLVERYQPNSRFWPNLEKDKRVQILTVKELLNRYQGYEGELIDIYYVKDKDPDLKIVIDLFLSAPKKDDYALLFVCSPNNKSFKPPIPAIKVGYDIGSCEEDCIFSSIFHEIIFGVIEELVVFKDLLNENFLFPDKESAEKYVRVHNEMSAQGKSVEDYMKMTIYEIWKCKTS